MSLAGNYSSSWRVGPGKKFLVYLYWIFSSFFFGLTLRCFLVPLSRTEIGEISVKIEGAFGLRQVKFFYQFHIVGRVKHFISNPLGPGTEGREGGRRGEEKPHIYRNLFIALLTFMTTLDWRWVRPMIMYSINFYQPSIV